MNFFFVSNIIFLNFYFSKGPKKIIFFFILFYVYVSDYKIDENFEFYSRKETKKEIITIFCLERKFLGFSEKNSDAFKYLFSSYLHKNLYFHNSYSSKGE